MPKLSDVCRHLRSKNAGPYWITIDIFFPDEESLRKYALSPALQADAIGALFDMERDQIKRYLVHDLAVLKLSYPRRHAQGGVIERDMHGGQQYVRLLNIDL